MNKEQAMKGPQRDPERAMKAKDQRPVNQLGDAIRLTHGKNTSQTR